ncbi:MAG: heme-binding domain-containing protein [Bergeyella zoohelcum]|nr:heme-binding domain-containing protein [Bergeyella zoohelcum]
MKKALKIALYIVVVFALVQFIPVDRTNPPVQTSNNFAHIFKTPKEVEQILRKACYDCHSNETIYPRYAFVAPISWSVKHHINKGRKHLNFSEWGTYNQDLKEGMLRNSVADIEQNRMPLAGYIAQHPEAQLTDQEKQLVIDYLNQILKSGKY